MRARAQARDLEGQVHELRQRISAALRRHVPTASVRVRACQECGMPWPCATRLDLTGEPAPPDPGRPPQPRIAGVT